MLNEIDKSNEKNDQYWECKHCTYHNYNMNESICQMCQMTNNNDNTQYNSNIVNNENVKCFYMFI